MTNFDAMLAASPQHERLATRISDRLWARTVRAVRSWMIARDVGEMQAMTDHMLHDIGLNRADVSHAIRTGKLPDC